MQKLYDKDLKKLQLDPVPKAGKMITDACGMTVIVRYSTSGENVVFFKMRYRDENNKRQWVTIGKYPETTLIAARMKYASLLEQSYKGKKPTLRTDEPKKIKNHKITLGELWIAWRAVADARCSGSTSKKFMSSWRAHLSKLSEVPVADITAQSIMSFLQAYLKEKQLATAKRLGQHLHACLEYGVFINELQSNPLDKLTRFLPQSDPNSHYASFGYENLEDTLKKFFTAIHGINSLGEIMIHFTFYTLLRHLEVRSLEVGQVEGNYAYVKTKTMTAFKVFFSTQAQQILKYQIERHQYQLSPYVFEGRVGGLISDHTMRSVIERAGYGDKFTVHGIRAVGRQWLQTLPDAKESIIEQCLSHVVGSRTEQAYNRGDYFEERGRIMQKWCDFVEKCIGNNNEWYTSVRG